MSNALASKGAIPPVITAQSEVHPAKLVFPVCFFFLFWLSLGAFYTSSPPYLLCTQVHISTYVFAVVFLEGLTGFKYRMGLSDWECYLFPEIFPAFYWAVLLVPFLTSGFKCIRNTKKHCKFTLLIWQVPLIIKWGTEDHPVCSAVTKFCLQKMNLGHTFVSLSAGEVKYLSNYLVYSEQTIHQYNWY